MANSEAQRIVDHLIDELGMQGAAIAREIGVKADTIQNIRRRHSTGNLQVQRLRILRDQMFTAAGQSQTPPSLDVPTQPVIDQLPSVDDLLAPVKETPEASGLSLNADEPAPNAPKKLTERAGDWLRAAMLGDAAPTTSQPSMTAPSRAKKTKAEAGEQGDLIEQLVPLAALLFVMSGSLLLPDPYKPCGPNTDEATAIAYPIVKRAVRELDARKRLSEATTDAIAILLAVGAYGVRAHETYKQIHTQEVERARSNRQPPDAGFIAASGGGPSNATAPTNHAGAGPDRADGAQPLPLWRGSARVTRQGTRAEGSGADRGAASPERRAADASIDALLAMDHAGRQRLGL